MRYSKPIPPSHRPNVRHGRSNTQHSLGWSDAPSERQQTRHYARKWAVWRINDDGEGATATSGENVYRNLTAEAAKLIAGALRDEQSDEDCERWTFLAGLSVPHALSQHGMYKRKVGA